ncbi:MAG: MarR family transcriptional regulator, partial [Labilithrix sp.]|nr:MarR family transcriptional regulator [Labilithrix sp.]
MKCDGLSIRDYSEDLAESFYRINAEWIEEMFSLEDNDRDILSNPRARIIDRGGVILFVEADGIGIVGTCALIKT